MPRPMFDSEYLYGLHDPGGEQLMLDAGAPGWVVISEEIKADPNDHGGQNYTHLSGRGLGVIVRLNYGYPPASTIPYSARYEDFAKRCANFVHSSPGCRIWIIGNETNMYAEQPKSPDEKITPALYARCYRLCRNAIHAVDPGAQVLVGAVAPWNAETGDWIKYFEDVLKLVAGECDGFTLHTYSRSPDPAIITSPDKMGPPFHLKNYSKEFATYQDFLRVVPASMRSLPCYITEANYGTDIPEGQDRWEDRNTGWIRRAYEDINGWNQNPGNQVIRALVLYRWASYDRFAIEGKNGAKEDLKQALSAGFKWPQRAVVVDDPFAALRKRLADLEAQVAKLLADLQKALAAGAAASGPLVARIADLSQRAGAVTAADAEAGALTRGVTSLEALLALPPDAVPQPDLQDLRGSLPQTAPYPTRDVGAIRRVVIHHTGIADGNLSPQTIAKSLIRTGKLGITYHFLINTDGALYWTQPLEAIVPTSKADVNADSIAVALGGNFTEAVPAEAQFVSAAHLVAWLLSTYQLGVEAVIGRREVEKSAPSPGNQWNTGACYRERLLADVQTWLNRQPPPDDTELAKLRQRVDELTAQVGQLQVTTTQLEQETQTLRAALTQKEQDIAGLRAALAQKEQDIAGLRAALAQKELQIAELTEQVRRLQGEPPTPGVVKPDIKDPGPLKQHDTKRYPTRPLSDIKRIVVHHTVTSGTLTPQRLAEVQVGKGLPGITYHFLISGDGTIYATQPLETITEQTTKPALDANSVGVALAGNFTTVAPPAAQLDAAAKLIAWLLVTYNLGNDTVVGRSELENVGSPGSQWLSGAAFKHTLLAAVAAERAKAPPDDAGADDSALVAQLRGQISGLTQERADLKSALALAQAEVALLRGAGGQVADLQVQVQSLQQQVAAGEATMTQLRSSITALQAEIARLRAGQPAGVPQPTIVDMIGKLATHPTLPPYAKRTRPITMIAVHHTDTPLTHTVETIAHYHVFGERKKGDQVIKAPWPGVGYHYIVAPDGAIYHCQPDDIRSYQVGGEPNSYTVAVSLIGRFMRTDLQGKPHPPEKQEPTAVQLASASQLIAWLLQKYSVPLQPKFENSIPVTGVVGHRDIWDQVQKGATVCPGDQWKTGIAWRDKLYQSVQSWLDGQPKSSAKPIKHYLLLWDHGAGWAQDDWRNAQDYIAAFRPTAGFSVTDAMQAEVVTIVGGDAGVSGADEARLVAAGCRVFRLAGVDEADTRARLAALIAAGTPYPGAAVVTRGIETPDPWDRGPEVSSDPPRDAWTVPDDWPAAGFDPVAAEDEAIDIPGVTRGVGKATKAKTTKPRTSQPKSTASDTEPKPKRKRSKSTGGAA